MRVKILRAIAAVIDALVTAAFVAIIVVCLLFWIAGLGMASHYNGRP